MTASLPCPVPERLRDHVDGLLPDHHEAEVMAHLDTCPTCQQTLDELACSDGTLWRLARELRELRPETADARAPKDPAQLSRSLLEPPEQAGHLGKLGPYEILEVIGRGGMGVVVKAVDPDLQRTVAIKVPTLNSDQGRNRFLREARAAAGVRHEHVIVIHAVQEAKGVPYLVLEYVAGMSLQERLDRDRELPLEDILRIGMQAAWGLAAAHDRGVIHRDIKPSNLLLEANTQRVKITDFGLARAVDDASISQSGVVAGTPQYMAPEQADGKAVDCRADLFSLGSVLYTMCTGQPPFQAETSLAILKKVCEQPPTRLRDINPNIPDWFEAIIAKLHAKSPDDRFQSASEVAELLGRHLAHLQQPALAPLPPSLRKHSATRSSRYRRIVAAVVAAGIVIAAVVAVPEMIIRIRDKDGRTTEIKVLPPATVEIEEDGKVIARAPAIVGTSVSIRRFDKYGGRVQSVAISPDGTRILVGRRDVTMQLLDATSGEEVRVFKGHDDVVSGVAFSQDGRQALSCSRDKIVRLWNVDTGQEVRRFMGHTDAVTSVAFCTDGKHALSGSEDKTLRLWKLDTGEELRRFEGHTGGVISLALSADGLRALSGSLDWTMRLWDLESGRELRCFEGHETWVWSVAFSADGRLALSGSGTHTRDAQGRPFDCLVRLWDLETGKLQRHFVGHSGEVSSVAFCSKGSHILSSSTDGNVRLWDTNTGELVHRFIGSKTMVSTLTCARDERRFITGSDDGSIRVWGLPAPLPSRPVEKK